jgi:FAD/FMN-containing dehydrogenase
MQAPLAQESWGKFPTSKGTLCTPHWLDELGGYTNESTRFLMVGRSMSYGDCGLNPDGCVVSARELKRIQSFDEVKGVLRAEPGATFADINALTVPRGWLLPVTPGTRHVTLGGAVAADVHGKNHLVQGSFGHHVRRLTLLRSDKAPTAAGEIICDALQNADLFRATIGGLGLTGMISSVEVGLRRIRSSWVSVRTERFRGIESFLTAARSQRDSEYFIGWFANCGRQGVHSSANIQGVILYGDHADEQRPASQSITPSWSIPPLPSGGLLNRWSSAIFNFLYYHTQSRRARVRPLDAFLYPLDGISNWNNLYGPAGLLQYQAVFPDNPEAFVSAMDAVLAIVGTTPFFLGTLKRFGHQPPAGMLSFARPGITVAMDFANHGQRTLAMFDKLNDVARDHGGAIYPAKDATMRADHFRAGYSSVDEFRTFIDPAMTSGLARRVGLVK